MIDATVAAAIGSVCAVVMAIINLIRLELVARRVHELRLLALEEQRSINQMAQQQAYSRGQLAERQTPRVPEPPRLIEPQ